MATTARKLTYADYAKIPSDGFRHEIIGGEEFMTPAPGTEHQTAVGNLFRILSVHVRTNRLGRVFVAPTHVVLSKHDIVEPDVLFVLEKHLSIITPKNIQGAPDLVIEVVSPFTETQDRDLKQKLYKARGVPEYWIVDPPSKTVEIHEFGKTRRTRIYQEGQSFESSLLSGLVVQVSDVFSI